MIKPTAKLRFFEKTIHFQCGTTKDDIPIIGGKKYKVLQQWWEDEYNYDSITGKFYGEWRDVPLEEA